MIPAKILRAIAAAALTALLFSMTACAPLLALLGSRHEDAAPTPNATAKTSEPAEASDAEETSAAEEPDGTDEAPAADEASAPLDEDALSAALTEAAQFYLHWFYDRSFVIDPAYSDIVAYPPIDADGSYPVYPTAVDGIATYDDLLAAVEHYFEHDTAVTLLDAIGAVDQDGRLCVIKSDGLGGTGMKATVTADSIGNGVYALTMDYSSVVSPDATSSVTLWYTPGVDTEMFGGTETSVRLFFNTLLYAEQLDYVIH